MTNFSQWTAKDAAAHIAVPTPADDKYSRGVLGVITGSEQYPGAAVLGVDAAVRAGVGMVRYLGPARATELVLRRRPETVAVNGRVQAWLMGSGMDYSRLEEAAQAQMEDALGQGLPVVLDGGALHFHSGVKGAAANGPVVITPHHGELARLMETSRDEIEADAATAAARAAEQLGVVVLLKGNTTHVASPEGARLFVKSPSTWLCTAGTGDSLAGVLGSLVATHSEGIAADPRLLAKLAATASVIHGLAGARASHGGPFTVLDLNRELNGTISGLLMTS